MRYILLIAGLLLLSTTVVVADVDINYLRLHHANGETVLDITADGVFQISHQTVEAKDGKPFRVIVDIFPAVHKLNKKAFTELPQSIVNSIRTSQYSVDPTNTVRIVLDLEKTSIYRVDKKNNTVSVYIPDKSHSGFAQWVSGDKKPVVSTKKTTAEPASKSVPVTAREDQSTTSKKPVTQLGYFEPKQTNLIDSEMIRPESHSKLSEKELVNTDEPVEEKNKDAAPKKKSVKPEKGDDNKKEKSRPDTANQGKPSPTEYADADSGEKSAVAVVKPKGTKPESTSKFKKVKVASKPQTSSNNEQQPASSDKGSKESIKTEKSDPKPTSRFRRKPAFSAKLKGTMVAEFPTRMVIKYTPANSRDPFASLINKEPVSSEAAFSQNRIPDVETSRLVGVLESDEGQNRALLEDMDGYGYILKPGDKVKKGYISKIYSDKALFQLFEYGWSRTVALRLSDSE